MSQSREHGKQPKVKPRIKRGPVNRCFLLAAGLSGWAWVSAPAPGAGELGIFFHGLGIVGAAACAARGIHLLARDYRIRRDLAISQTTSDDHGSARQSTMDERAARGMAAQDHGEFYGLDDEGRPVWRPPATPFALIEMPPGAGKTSTLVIGSILHRARLGYSLVIPDVKEDLAASLAPKLREAGYEVWCVNPARSHLALIGETIVNPYQALIDAVYGDARARKDAVKIAADYAALHYPMMGDEKNPYFAFGSRRSKTSVILGNALIDPANCTPTAAYTLLADPQRLLRRCREILTSLETSYRDDPVLEFLRIEASNLIHRAETNEENYASFCEGASQRLISFNPAGHLGHYGREAIHNLASIRERQVIVFIVTPLSHTREFADLISLLNHNIIMACKTKPSGHPVHIVGEEALAYRFNDLAGDLETMRQLGVTADFYIQSFAGLEKKYGKDVAAAIESYADIRIYAGLNSFERAKHVSGMLSETTVRKHDFSYQTTVEELGLSSREMGRSLMKPDEVLAMDKDHAWMFVKGLRPVRLQLVNYGQVSPWRDWVDPSPITGTRLRGAPVLHVTYPNGGSHHAKP